MEIRFMGNADLNATAEIHKATFVRQQLSRAWLSCNLIAFPRVLSFVAESDGVILGYIIWVQKSGFRPQVVLDLEQVAVLPNCQGQGVGRALIEESLPLVRAQLAERGANLKHIMVTTREDNRAQRLYQQTLGAQVEATIANLYSADEVMMIARNV